MWVLTVYAPWSEPREYVLKAGTHMLGRHPGNDIVIADDGASRLHAELSVDVNANLVTLRDLDSTNGTYVNRERIYEIYRLRPQDQIRIGQHRLTLGLRQPGAPSHTAPLAGVRPLTRETLLHSVDEHALVLYEVATRLNAILDPDAALAEVARLARSALGAAATEVIPVYRFAELDVLGPLAPYARQAIAARSIVSLPDVAGDTAAIPRHTDGEPIGPLLCVPGAIGDEVLVLAYAYRAGAAAQPFEQHATHLAVAIAYQAALTVQRTLLWEHSRQLDRHAAGDAATALPDEAHFLELAELEYLRARRFQRPLSALILAGPETAADAALGRAAREALREGDLMGVYQGRLALLLPDCDEAARQHVAQRLQQRLDALAPGIHPPLALGGATLSEYDQGLMGLLGAASATLA
jgi:hypothetical protein